MSEELPPDDVLAPKGSSTSGDLAGWALVVLAAAVGVVVSVFMEWATEHLFDESRSAQRVPLQFLWDTTPATFDSLPVMWPVLLGAVLMVVGVLSPKRRGLAVVGSAMALIFALWYVNGVRAAVDYYDFQRGVGELVGIGTWVCVVAGAVGLVASIFSVRSRADTPAT